MIFEKINSPTLIIDKSKCKKNIEYFVEKTQKNNLIFRPHFKTHNSIEIGNWFREFGIDKITTSSAKMAKKFAEVGWGNITIAFPLSVREIDLLNKISEKIQLNLIVSCNQHQNYIHLLSKNIIVLIELDLGYHRSGFEFNEIYDIKKMINIIENSKVNFGGFLFHEGQNYNATSREDLYNFHQKSLSKLSSFLHNFDNPPFISFGDTPSCKTQKDFTNIDELRPGNFIFYDLMQLNIGSCDFEEIAVAVACPVVSINNSLKQIIIYGGAIHLSKEYIIEDGNIIFGKVVLFYENAWSKPLLNTVVISLSQEHGIISTSTDLLEYINVGDILGIIPVHSCLTNNLLSENTLIIND